jgi:hypothetical protein
LRQQALGARAYSGGRRRRDRDRRRRRERAQLRCVPTHVPPPGAPDRIHADAANEPRGELSRESRVLEPRRGRLERARPAHAARLRQALRPGGVRPEHACKHRRRRAVPVCDRQGDARGGDGRRGRAVRELQLGGPPRRRALRLPRQLHGVRPARAAALPVPTGGARRDRAPRGPGMGSARRGGGRDRAGARAQRDAPPPAHPGAGRAQPGARVREPRLARAARRPCACTAGARRRRDCEPALRGRFRRELSRHGPSRWEPSRR